MVPLVKTSWLSRRVITAEVDGSSEGESDYAAWVAHRNAKKEKGEMTTEGGDPKEGERKNAGDGPRAFAIVASRVTADTICCRNVPCGVTL